MNNYTIYDEFITLGKFLKEAAIIETGGAAKQFLATNDVLYNGEYENRRGKKLYAGDTVEFPGFGLKIDILAATPEEIAERESERAEEDRVKAIVKKMNADNKKADSQKKAASNNKEQYFKRTIAKKAKPKFPGAK
ncbi:S4 domain-containing protein YaaA [Pseudolactococcus insecticola]|nr:S4 domain-containing protein YaaA [Lactococcus insecticola]